MLRTIDSISRAPAPRLLLLAAVLALAPTAGAQLESGETTPQAFPAPALPLRFEVFPGTGQGSVSLPRTAILPEELAVVIDVNQPVSIQVGEYYAAARGIPVENLVYVAIPPDPLGHTYLVIGEDEYLELKASIDQALADRPQVQGMALAWKFPYTVDGRTSITTALAHGGSFVDYWADCDSGHQPQPPSSPFYGASTTMPYTDFGIRPAMALATENQTFDEVRALIDRSVASDRTYPGGDGYLFRTSDELRSVRWTDMDDLPELYGHAAGFAFSYEDNHDPDHPRPGGNELQNTPDVMFYFTGHAFEPAHAPTIFTNTYLPGSIADHLTSSGGRLHPGGGQMKITQWLAAGASASYGTVMEPCNTTSKFPRVSVLARFYFEGGSILDSYWRSVAIPSQGIFVGEPLARPWAPIVVLDSSGLSITTALMEPGKTYFVESSTSPQGPWTQELVLPGVAQPSVRQVRLTTADPDLHYRLVPDLEPPTTPPFFTSPLQCNDPFRSFYWGASTDETQLAGYQLYKDCGGSVKPVAFTQELYHMLDEEITCLDGSLGTSQEVAFFVTAVDSSGNESGPSERFVVALLEK